MRPLFYFIIISLFLIYSCGTKDQKATLVKKETNETNISMVGKWYRWSKENGYSEFEIDSEYVSVFSEKNGKSKLKYLIENDSFKYLTIDYTAKIIPWGDTMIVLRNAQNTATLIRFDESVHAFESVPDEKNSLLFNSYQEGFYERADEAWAKAGLPKGPGDIKDSIFHIQ